VIVLERRRKGMGAWTGTWGNRCKQKSGDREKKPQGTGHLGRGGREGQSVRLTANREDLKQAKTGNYQYEKGSAASFRRITTLRKKM